METNSDKERIEAAKKYASENNQVIAHGLYSTYGDRELGFIAGAEYERTIANQQLIEKDFRIRDLEVSLALMDQQLAEKDKEITELGIRLDKSWLDCKAKHEEIASLKDALRKAENVLIAVDEEGDKLFEEIENLLK